MQKKVEFRYGRLQTGLTNDGKVYLAVKTDDKNTVTVLMTQDEATYVVSGLNRTLDAFLPPKGDRT